MIRAAAVTALVLDAAIAFSSPAERYALILGDPPLAARHDAGRRTRLLRAQGALRSVLADRRIAVTGSTQALLNAVFVTAPPGRLAELRALPGVAAVAPMARLTRQLNKAIDLVNAAAAWSGVGGASNAGAGMKIAVLDSGIDETHPGFQDPLLSMPAGFPKSGNADDATHATNKIIAVRSYVAQLAIPNDTPAFTLPDDLSARDRVGHGTAVAMIAAGVSHRSPVGTISGVAPKAWLGNYKIFGSPGVNDATTADVVLQALEAAFTDGMDVALLSIGGLPAQWGASDQGGACKLPSGVLCDPWVAAVSTATRGGMIVVVPAGNDGDLGGNTINTPGDLPAALTVGATTNAHELASTVATPAGDRLQARLGDGPQLLEALSAPLAAAASIDSTGHGCLGFPAGSLSGTIALLTVGECSLATKVLNAQRAGAAAVLLFNLAGGALFSPTGLSNTGIPAALIAASSGALLNSYLVSHPGTTVKLDSTTEETASGVSDRVAYFSSRGPNIGDAGIKPDLVAPGASIYTAAQSYDPNGELYSSDRYIGVDGTSFAAAFAAGAAALVKQAHAAYNSGQIASALVNAANPSITDVDANGNPMAARAVAIGGGKLNVQGAIASTVTIAPPSLSFGVVNGGLPSRTITITNTGSAAASVQLSVQQRDADSNASVGMTPSSLNLAPGQSGSVTVALTGKIPSPGLYEGAIAVSGGAVPLRIPYLYISSNGTPSNLIPLLGRNFVTESGSIVDLAFRVLDPSGSPVPGMQVRFAPPDSVYAATPSTDGLGIAEAYLRTGAQNGDQRFTADLIGNAGRVTFDGRTRSTPNISANGVVDAASFQAPAGFAAGSYLTLFGTGLSESFEVTRTASLPLSLAGVSLSFDVPGTGIHVPGRLYFVSSTQITAQIPWEVAGQPAAVIKVTLNNSQSKSVRPEDINLSTNQSQLATIPIAAYSPAFFEYTEAGTGKLLAAALDENNALIGSARPALRGHTVQFFVNGLGPVATGHQPPSGEPTPATLPLASTQTLPVVIIGGQQAVVQFSGLAPLSVGLYQVNAVVPTGLSPGFQPATISITGVGSRATTLAVQ